MTILATILLPLMSQSLFWLSCNAVVMGIAGSLLHGMLKQLSSMACRDGQLPVAVTAGMQASAIFVLAISFMTGFGRTGNSHGLSAFFVLVALLEVGCAYCFFRLMFSSHRIRNTLGRRDTSFQITAPLLRSNTSDGEIAEGSSSDQSDFDVNTNELPIKELLVKTWPACLTIGVTVASSMLVSSCFDRVQSEDEEFQALPQVLYYTRLFSDLLGRPATLVARPDSSGTLIMLSLLRLSFVPIFFLYTNSTMIPKNDMAAIVAIFLFSFSSGFLATVSYQIAPMLLQPNEREMNRGFQASLINVCFSFSIVIGLVASSMITRCCKISTK